MLMHFADAIFVIEHLYKNGVTLYVRNQAGEMKELSMVSLGILLRQIAR